MPMLVVIGTFCLLGTFEGIPALFTTWHMVVALCFTESISQEKDSGYIFLWVEILSNKVCAQVVQTRFGNESSYS